MAFPSRSQYAVLSAVGRISVAWLSVQVLCLAASAPMWAASARQSSSSSEKPPVPNAQAAPTRQSASNPQSPSNPLSAANAQSPSNSTDSQLETRNFEVRIDNKPAGQYRLRLWTDGARTDVQSTCQVNYSVFVFHYHYSYTGHEQWLGDKVTGLDSDCMDGGKHFVISAHRANDKLVLSVNNKLSTVSGATALSSYWHLPVATGSSGSGQFLEVDSGRLFNARFDYVGKEPVQTGDTKQLCAHYKLSGGDEGDLWYDTSNRLVRQTSKDEGHTTTVQLESVSR